MTGRERIIAALERRQPDSVPSFEWFIDPGVGRALVGSEDPIDIVEALDLDGINVRPDYSKERIDARDFVDEWGCRRRLTGDCIPAVVAHPVANIESAADYAFPDPEAPERFATLERARERFGDERAVVLNVRDGFSDVRDLLGYENALMYLLTEREKYDAFLRRIVDYNRRLAEVARERYGVEVLATTDDVATASGLLMGPKAYFNVLAPRFQDAARGFKDLGYYFIKHCDGDVTGVVDFWIESGVDCIDPVDPGAGLAMREFKRRYGSRVCLKGNVDCAGTLCDGSEEDVVTEVRECLAAGGAGGGLILSSSNTIHRGVRPRNYVAMLRALREYGRYPLEGAARSTE